MVVVDGHGTPLGVCIESASPAEIKLVNTVLDTIPAHLLPEFLIGDRAYDSDPKDAELLAEYDVKLVSPNRSNRKIRTQDGRTLRRYRRRWIVERTNAWLLNFRRIVNRWEHRASNYAGFLRLACIVIMLRQF
jgi:transposase